MKTSFHASIGVVRCFFGSRTTEDAIPLEPRISPENNRSNPAERPETTTDGGVSSLVLSTFETSIINAQQLALTDEATAEESCYGGEVFETHDKVVNEKLLACVL